MRDIVNPGIGSHYHAILWIRPLFPRCLRNPRVHTVKTHFCPTAPSRKAISIVRSLLTSKFLKRLSHQNDAVYCIGFEYATLRGDHRF